VQDVKKYFGPLRVAFFSAAGVAVIFIFWELFEEFILGDEHTVDSFKYIIKGIIAAFIASAVFSWWAIRQISEEREKYEYELESVNKKLRELAITDGLTGTYNHRYFIITLEREWQRMERLHHPLSCVMIDLDDFKSVNDQYGHQAGDLVLREVACVLRQDLREIDIVSRYGGEEFVLLMIEKPGHKEGLLKTMERVRKRIAELKFNIKGKKFTITASLGGALVPDARLSSSESLVSAADKAMYAAKVGGKNCCRIFEG
jgi:diguanylate cyclase (GGDEF)-like protein